MDRPHTPRQDYLNVIRIAGVDYRRIAVLASAASNRGFAIVPPTFDSDKFGPTSSGTFPGASARRFESLDGPSGRVYIQAAITHPGRNARSQQRRSATDDGLGYLCSWIANRR